MLGEDVPLSIGRRLIQLADEQIEGVKRLS
jgi:hypothetical protein